MQIENIVCCVPLSQPSSRDPDYPLGCSVPPIKNVEKYFAGTNLLDFTKNLHINYLPSPQKLYVAVGCIWKENTSRLAANVNITPKCTFCY